MTRQNHKYCEVTVNFLGDTVEDDVTHFFCVNTASEHKATAIAREALGIEKEDIYSGRAVRKDKREGE